MYNLSRLGKGSSLEKKYLKCYIFMVLFYGLILIYFTPAMQSPDENTHFYNSYAISNGDIFADVGEAGVGGIGHYYPGYIGRFVDYYQNRFSDGENRFKIEQLWTETYFEPNTEELEIKTYWNADTNPIAYIVPAIGMWIVIHIGIVPVTPYSLLIAGRLMNLLLFLVVSTLALKITPIMKRTMMMLLLMPQTISLAASLNYDALLLPMVFLLFALVFSLNFCERKIKNWEIILFLLISTVLLCVKQAYFPLLLIAFSIPLGRFLSKKQYFAILGGCLFTAGLFFLIYKIPTDRRLDAVKAVMPEYSGQKAQIQYILSNIHMIPSIILNSVSRAKSFYINSFFGNLGRLEILYIPLYVIIYFVLLFFVMLKELRTEHLINLKTKVLSLISVMITIVLIFIGTYIIWTNFTVGIGADYVDGVQGRYFIMLVPYAMIPFCYCPKGNGYTKKMSDFITSRIEVNLFDVCMLYLNVCLLCGVIQLILYYWI